MSKTCIRDATITGIGEVKLVNIDGVNRVVTVIGGPFATKAQCQLNCVAGTGTQGGCDQIRVSMGSGQAVADGTTVVAINFAHPVPAGCKVIVEMGAAHLKVAGAPFGNPGAQFTPLGGSAVDMVLDTDSAAESSGGVVAKTWIFSYTNPSQCSSAVISASVTGGNAITGPVQTINMAAAEYVAGLSHNSFDKNARNLGLATVPDTGTTGDTSFPCEYAQATFLVFGNIAPIWSNGFFSGGQDEHGTLAGLDLTFTEGYKMLKAVQAADAALQGVQTAWTGDLNTYG